MYKANKKHLQPLLISNVYDHFSFDLQVRYALGLRDLKEGDFEIRTLW